MTDDHKTCSRGKELKHFDEFNFCNTAKGQRHSYCRECGKQFTRNHYKNNKYQYLERNYRTYHKRKEYIRNVKSRPCADCGVRYPYYVMDFDHREGELKEHRLSQVEAITLNIIKKEIAKCDVVCANCHRERTFQRLRKSASPPIEIS